MSITKNFFGTTPDGKEVFSYTLDNEKNVKAEILTYGGIVRSLLVKDKNGVYTDVVLGRETLEDYLNNDNYCGALIGRHANRIAYGKFNLNGTEYKLNINNGGHCHHGGINGFDKYIWNVTEINDGTNPSISLSIVSPDGDEGFPGELNVLVKYVLNEKNGLEIHYEATTTKDTVVNLTSHGYFNLNGAGSGTVLNHQLQMNCSFFTPNSQDWVPTGEILSVKETPFDFTSEKIIGLEIHSNSLQIKPFRGYDHNFIIDGNGFRKAATAKGDISGITMEVYTDKPGVQLYTTNFMDTDHIFKNGKTYAVHGAFCLETQFFPSSTSFSHFPSPILKKDDKYRYTTEYRFV